MLKLNPTPFSSGKFETSRLAFFSFLFIWFQLGIAGTNAEIAVPKPLPCLTNVSQVRNLPAHEAQRNCPVQIEGVVMHYDSKTFHDLVVQDETGGIYVMGTERQKIPLSPGQR